MGEVHKLRNAMGTAYSSNLRPSFFGGVVSSRLQAQDINKAIPPELAHVQRQRSQQRASNGAKGESTRKPAAVQQQQPTRKPLSDAEKRQRHMAAQKKAAERNSRMFDADAADDTFVPILGKAENRPSKAAVAAIAKKPDVKREAKKPETRHLAGGQKVVIHTAPQAQSQRALALGNRPALALQPTAAQKATDRNKLLSAAKSRAVGQGRGGLMKAAQPKDQPPKPSKPKATKVCGNCAKETPLKEFYMEKRTTDGLMRCCIKCATKKGLQGKPATPDVIHAIMKQRGATTAQHSTPAAARQQQSSKPGSSSGPPAAPGPSGVRNGTPAGVGKAGLGAGATKGQSGHARAAAAMQQRGFYNLPKGVAPAARAVQSGAVHRRVREDWDQYEADFVEASDEEEEDWRAQLREVTGGWRRRPVMDDYDDDRMMEATAAEMRAEEARSKRLGRQEDLEAEREEAARLATKEAKRKAKKAAKRAAGGKKKKKRRKGASAFINDEASDDDSDEDDSDEDSEGDSYDD